MTTPKKKRAPRKPKVIFDESHYPFGVDNMIYQELLSGATCIAQRYSQSPFEAMFARETGWSLWFKYGMEHPEGGEL